MAAVRLRMIFTSEELRRIRIMDFGNGRLRIIADVHGMKCWEARRFINNIINVIRAGFQLVIIHGYNHGTAIKDMLAQNFYNDHITERHPDPHNKGVTYLSIAA